MNLSKEKRERLLNYLEKLKENKEDEDIRIISEIENALNEKKYGLVWEEHSEKVEEELKTKIPLFTEVKDRRIEKDKEKPYNFLLEGDNLHSLKLLQKTHKGKIDVIYIDPPYNTGNKDFIYNDQYVDKTDGYSHSKWLSFMEKRLRIARELLTEEGVMFISIDDNEQAQLKLLCDEVFGGKNVETIVWHKEFEGNSGKMKRTKHFRDVHEYVIVCYNNYDKQFKKIKEPLDIIKFQTTNLAKNNLNKRGIQDRIFEIQNPTNGKIWIDEWKYEKNKIEDLLKNNLIYFGKDGNSKPREILPTDERREVYVETIITKGSSTQGRKEIENILKDSIFDNPKPIKLIHILIEISSNNNSTILDFFAGSGTTGHAVAKLNAEDGGARKYILCTNNENNICEDVTYKRLCNIQNELPHNLKYFRTDYIQKFSNDEVIPEMLLHIREMIELEHHINLDNKKYVLCYSEEKLQECIQNILVGGTLFITSGIFMTELEKKILDEKKVAVIEVPEYYFSSELKEIGEI